MPSSTMEDQPEWKLPKETLLPAVLNSVEEKSYPYTIKTGKRAGEEDVFTKWVWEFQITDGEYAGLRAWQDTDPKLTNHPDNLVRQYAETLLGTAFELGQGLDTDDLTGLPCVITVDNTIEERNGQKYYKTPVMDVFPADTETDPPF